MPRLVKLKVAGSDNVDPWTKARFSACASGSARYDSRFYCHEKPALPAAHNLTTSIHLRAGAHSRNILDLLLVTCSHGSH